MAGCLFLAALAAVPVALAWAIIIITKTLAN